MSIRRRLVCIIPVLCAAGMPALAQPPEPAPPAAATSEDEDAERPARAASRLGIARAPYPAVVKRAVDAGRKACRDAGGKHFLARPGLVRTGDLTGDGRPDFVVDFREARCPERLTLFSGTGGWDVDIFAARPAGGPIRIFSGRVLDYALVDDRKGLAMRFQIHGSYCDRAGTDPCVRQRRLTTRPFAFRER
ncbi:hypothetical protein [Methylobacterium sp. Leaf118]|uniref:hypothetical protein n=1 Tax=Methylobacterium sp. Leaf118 TaxID=2876562 RepID=UPI001E5C7816|nr:hypothetical protein [Methylobacterium sp. Leaf118]